jgi:hypothetical protein
MAAADITNSAVAWAEARIASGTVTATPTVTGSRATVNVMVSLLAALVQLGIIIDSTTA